MIPKITAKTVYPYDFILNVQSIMFVSYLKNNKKIKSYRYLCVHFSQNQRWEFMTCPKFIPWDETQGLETFPMFQPQ